MVGGGGPAGLSAAVLLARNGLRTVLVAPREPPPGTELRTTALLGDSVALLDRIGAWHAIEGRAAPLLAMRLIDDTGRLLRAPTVVFRAAESGRDSFGANVPNDVLVAALEEVAAKTAGLERLDAFVAGAEPDPDAVTVTTDKGERVRAPLAVAAEGRRSVLREAAGIGVVRWRYEQTALTLNLGHSRPHGDISTEFHTPSGPFTLVPLGPDMSSLVAVLRPADAARLAQLPDAELGRELERRAHSLLGRFTVLSRRAAWPLEGLTPRRFAQKRIALVGEAAHVLPPIGAQGLNLGFRDAEALAGLAALPDPGAATVLDAYERARRADVVSRTFGVDALNRTLLSPFLPAQALRGLGLLLAETLPPFRRALVEGGLALRRR